MKQQSKDAAATLFVWSIALGLTVLFWVWVITSIKETVK